MIRTYVHHEPYISTTYYSNESIKLKASKNVLLYFDDIRNKKPIKI